MEFKWVQTRITFMVGKEFTKWWARPLDSYLGYGCHFFFWEIICYLYSIFWCKGIWFKKWTETSCYFRKTFQQLERLISTEANLPFENFKICKLGQSSLCYLLRWPRDLPRSQEKLSNNQKIHRVKRLNQRRIFN